MLLRSSLFRILLLFIFLLPHPAALLAGNDSLALKDGKAPATQESGVEKKKKKKDADLEFFEIKVDRLTDKFFSRLLVDLFTVLILIRFIYFRIYKNGEFFFTFLVFNLIIFLITYLLNKVDMSLGAAFGLFAVFSMLRYRTEGISAREMTYLFVVISVGLITAVSKGTVIELLIINAIIILFVFLLESDLFLKRELSQTVQYDRLDNILPENKEQLLADLRKRTGLPIHRISIGNFDLLKDSAAIKVYYYEEKK
jgi:hypothetical protein